MSEIKIAVIGSCVSRDAFNSQFIKDYKQFYKCVLTQNHVSMISLMSEPIPYLPEKITGNISDFNKQILLTDLSKSVWDSLNLLNPDYLILDFYADVYFGILKIGNSYLTDKSWTYNRTTFFNQFNVSNSFSLETNYSEYMMLWKNSADAFMTRMKRDFSNIKIIVNKVHFTDLYMTNDGGELKSIRETGKYKNIDVDEINGWLDEFYQYFEDRYKKEVFFIHYDKEYISHENHIWEYFYVHYTQDFYEDFTTKLISIILKDLSQTKKTLSTEKKSEVKSAQNLLRNSSFKMGKAFWTFWQDKFEIHQPEKDNPDAPIVTIQQSGLTKKAYRQIWSNPVEINTDGTLEFTISFDIKVKDISKVDADGFIFSLRTYNKVDHVLQKECVWYKNIKIEEISHLKNDTWVHFSYVFRPKSGKFLKVGPYLMQNGHVSWRNISLVKGRLNGNVSQSYKRKNRFLFSMKKLLKRIKR